jgi:hypothetical protein
LESSAAIVPVAAQRAVAVVDGSARLGCSMEVLKKTRPAIFSWWVLWERQDSVNKNAFHHV